MRHQPACWIDLLDEGQLCWAGGGDGVDGAEHGFGLVELGGAVSEEGEERLALGDGIALFGVDFDAGGCADGIAGFGATGTEALDGPAHLGAVGDVEKAVGFGVQDAVECRLVMVFWLGKDGDVAGLGFDDAEPGVPGGTVGEELVGEEVAGLGGLGVVGEVEHPAGEGVGEVDEIGGEGVAGTAEYIDALADLIPVAGEAAEGLGHVGEEGDGAAVIGVAGGDHELGKEAGVGGVLHEGAGAGFYIKDEGVEGFSELFAHDAGGDERG